MSDDLLDVYGQCAAKPCACLKSAWLGRACPHWKPNGAKTVKELLAMARETKARNDAVDTKKRG